MGRYFLVFFQFYFDFMGCFSVLSVLGTDFLSFSFLCCSYNQLLSVVKCFLVSLQRLFQESFCMSYSPISLYHFSSQKEKSNIDWITPSSLVMNLHVIVQTLNYSVQTRLTRIWSRYYHSPLSSTSKCCRTDRVRSVSLRVCTASVWAQIFWHFPCHIDLFMWMCWCVAQTSQRK